MPQKERKERKAPSITPSILSPAMPTVVPNGNLTRSKVARRLGVSVTTLRRMEGTLLHPQTGEGGVRMFDADEVEAAVIRVRRRERPEEPETGAVAAEVFTLFDEGVHPVDVIKKLLLAPNPSRFERLTYRKPPALPGMSYFLSGIPLSPRQPPQFYFSPQPADLELLEELGNGRRGEAWNGVRIAWPHTPNHWIAFLTALIGNTWGGVHCLGRGGTAVVLY